LKVAIPTNSIVKTSTREDARWKYWSSCDAFEN
jgi:hypothetical protein